MFSAIVFPSSCVSRILVRLRHLIILTLLFAFPSFAGKGTSNKRKWEIRESSGKGLGIFATRDIPVATRIFSEKPLLEGREQLLLTQMMLHPKNFPDEVRALVREISTHAARAESSSFEDVQNELASRKAGGEYKVEGLKGIGRAFDDDALLGAGIRAVGTAAAGALDEEALKVVGATAVHETASGKTADEEYYTPAARRAIDRLVHVALEQQLGKESPKIRDKILALEDGWATSNKTKTLGGIMRTNAFTDGGLFEKMSRLNHACEPNAMRGKADDGVYGPNGKWEIRASRDIIEGEEITLDYGVRHVKDVEKRRAWLKWKYNFWCGCDRCRREGGVVVGGKDEAGEAPVQQERGSSGAAKDPRASMSGGTSTRAHVDL